METRISVYDDTLAHYGVKGMKWGVRRNPSRAYTKAVKKKSSLESKSVRYGLKSAKARKKAMKTRWKAEETFDAKKAKKARKLEKKSVKYELKSAKARAKALKWTNEMNKTFSGYKISQVQDPKRKGRGQKFVYEVTKRAS